MQPGSKLKFLLIAIHLAQIEAYKQYSKEFTMLMIKSSCNLSRFMCPRQEYFDINTLRWYEDRLMKSEVMQKTLSGGMKSLKHAFESLKEEFCCTEGPCLNYCNIFEKKEISLISKFPENVDAIFSLGIPKIEKHREEVYKYLEYIKAHGSNPRHHFPAEIEAYFDDLSDQQHLIHPLLSLRYLQEIQGIFNN
uniref:NR LBD domain-containing protein n=1 Tax=Caenorhabditis japonica TaxID=281687 RepID=A0A8R1I646_CAEJA